LRRDSAAAVTALEKAVELSQGKEPMFLATLADAYSKVGRFADAVQTADRALGLTRQTHDVKLENKLQDDIKRYQLQQEQAKPQ